MTSGWTAQIVLSSARRAEPLALTGDFCATSGTDLRDCGRGPGQGKNLLRGERHDSVRWCSAGHEKASRINAQPIMTLKVQTDTARRHLWSPLTEIPENIRVWLAPDLQHFPISVTGPHEALCRGKPVRLLKRSGTVLREGSGQSNAGEQCALMASRSPGHGKSAGLQLSVAGQPGQRNTCPAKIAGVQDSVTDEN